MPLTAADLSNKSSVFNEIQHAFSAQTRGYVLNDLRPNQGQTTWQAPPQAFIDKAVPRGGNAFSVNITSYKSVYRVDIVAKDAHGTVITHTVGQLGH
jgi:hypothetical protein